MNFNKLITSVPFVTFNAHCFFAAFCVLFAHLFVPLPFVVASALIIAAAKEFWYDLRFERYPPQTVEDSTKDFVEYCFGIALGALAVII